jgi:hypothetical protein
MQIFDIAKYNQKSISDKTPKPSYARQPARMQIDRLDYDR